MQRGFAIVAGNVAGDGTEAVARPGQLSAPRVGIGRDAVTVRCSDEEFRVTDSHRRSARKLLPPLEWRSLSL